MALIFYKVHTIHNYSSHLQDYVIATTLDVNGTDCAINATDITDNTTSFVNCETCTGFSGKHGDGNFIYA